MRFTACAFLVALPLLASASLVRRQSAAPNSLVAYFGLVGNPGCDYAASFQLNGVSLMLLVDTGSSNLASASTSCPSSQCPQKALLPYNAQAGATPNIQVNYGTPSTPSGWSGFITDAKLSFPAFSNATKSATTFAATAQVAAITQATCFFQDSCPNSGILGMAYQSISTNNQPTFMDLVAANGFPNNFALQLCINERVQQAALAKFATSRTGNMWLGGVDSSFFAPGASIAYTNIVEKNYYQVQLQSFTVAGTNVPGIKTSGFTGFNAIVDSGTTLIVMNTKNYNNFLNFLVSSSFFKFPSGVTNDQKLSFFKGDIGLTGVSSYTSLLSDPTQSIAVQLGGGVNLNIDWSALFIQVQTTVYFTGFGDSGSDDDGTILGESLFVGKVVVFDRGNSRIGFVNSASPKCLNRAGNAASAQGIDTSISSASTHLTLSSFGGLFAAVVAAAILSIC